MEMNKRTLVGIVLLFVGSVLLFPAAGVGTTGIAWVLAPATVLMAAGTYLVGTDVSGKPA
ncbi:MAG: hypothetical protein A07HB70_01712 [uncultured archaeon A07HB70]|nr:MAG: hypothetical protein A07HB70_01712 [uncultured archaeon A07HB70]